jgi:hypothetical protein
VAPDAVRPAVGAYLVGSDGPGSLSVQHRRTGATWTVRAEVRRPDGATVDTLAQADHDGNGKTFPLGWLPEYEQEQIRLALRRELRRQVLTPEEDRRIAEGSLRFDRAVAFSLVRQLPADPREAHGLDFDRLSRTLDLLALERLAIPFDAQTRFYRILTRGPRETRRHFARLAPRFGFVAGVTDSG